MANRFSVEAIIKAKDRFTAPVTRMQNSIGKFTRAAERQLRRVNRRLNAMTKGLLRGAGAAAKIGAAAIVAGITAVTLALNNMSDSADELAKRTRRMQFPIEEFQEWLFVSEQSGVPQAKFNSSMEAFVKRLGEAKAGFGPLTAGLKKTNPELLKQLVATDSVADALDIYVKAMRNTTDAAERNALANAAFSRSGLAMANIADNTAESLAAMRREQRENGVITLKQAEAAEAYNDAVNSLKNSLFGLLRDVLLPLTPALTKNFRAFREWVVANREMLRTRIFEFFDRTRRAIVALAKRARDLIETHDLFARLGETMEFVVKVFGFLAEHGKTIAMVVAGIVALTTVLNIFIGVMTAVNIVMAMNPVGLIVLGIATLIAIIAAAIIWWDEITVAIRNSTVAFDAMVIAVAAMTGPIGWLIGAAVLIFKHWEPIKGFFADVGDSIVSAFTSAVEKIKPIIDWLKNAAGFIIDMHVKAYSAAGDLFGFGGDDDEQQSSATPQMVSPQERTARSIEERRTTGEVVIKDETGKASESKPLKGTGAMLMMQPTGAF